MRKMKTMDGNQAAAHISYGFTEVAAIYPNTWMNGRLTGVKMCSDTLLR